VGVWGGEATNIAEANFSSFRPGDGSFDPNVFHERKQGRLPPPRPTRARTFGFYCPSTGGSLKISRNFYRPFRFARFFLLYRSIIIIIIIIVVVPEGPFFRLVNGAAKNIMYRHARRRRRANIRELSRFYYPGV